MPIANWSAADQLLAFVNSMRKRITGTIGLIFRRTRILISIWALLIFALCSVPGEYIPSTHWLDLLGADKWVHAIIFFVLNILVIVDLAKYRRRNSLMLASFLICVVYGISLEVMQAWFFSNRSADVEDAAANTVGCLLALLFIRKIRRLASLQQPPSQ